MLKMVPIGKDTQLCAVLGRDAFSSKALAYFNAIFVLHRRDIAAIALNVSAEHFALTFSRLGTSKVDKLYILPEYAQASAPYCDVLDADAERFGDHALEVKEGLLYGYNLQPATQEQLLLLGVLPDDDERALIVRCYRCAQMWFGLEAPTPEMIDQLYQGANDVEPR